MARALHPLYARVVAAVLTLMPVLAGHAAELAPPEVLFRDVRVFDGRSAALSGRTAVLVRGNRIAAIGAGATPAGSTATIVDGGGRTLIPGLIDAHTHIMFATLPPVVVLTSDIGFVNFAATKAAGDMLMRGFTSIRDLGGPVLRLKRGIDLGLGSGPRIWPAGAFISQTGGHGDFRPPNDLPARPGDFTYSERVGAAAIAQEIQDQDRVGDRHAVRRKGRGDSGRAAREVGPLVHTG